MREWKQIELGKFVDLGKQKYQPSPKEDMPCVELETIEKRSGRITHTIDSSTLSSMKNKFMAGDVLFGKLRPYLRKYALTTSAGICSTEIWVLRPQQNLCISKFLFLLVQTDRFIYKANLSCGSRMPRADWDLVASTPFLLPPIEEQRKIVEVLETWDKAIGLTKQLIEQKELQKKYLMQQLLTGRIRLKGFTGKWKNIKLGAICTIRTGKLDANAMKPNGKYKFFTCAQEVFSIDTFAFDTEALLVSGNGANVGYIHYYKGKFNAYQRTYVLDSFSEHIVFIKYILNSSLYYRIEKEKKAGNTPYIVLSTLADMQMYIPQAQGEQKAIADTLSSCDKEIDLLKQKLTKLEEQKKGLMQVLLTGKVKLM